MVRRYVCDRGLDRLLFYLCVFVDYDEAGWRWQPVFEDNGRGRCLLLCIVYDFAADSYSRSFRSSFRKGELYSSGRMDRDWRGVLPRSAKEYGDRGVNCVSV